MRVLAWNWDPTHEKSLKRYLRRPPKANHKNSRLDAKEVCSYVGPWKAPTEVSDEKTDLFRAKILAGIPIPTLFVTNLVFFYGKKEETDLFRH